MVYIEFETRWFNLYAGWVRVILPRFKDRWFEFNSHPDLTERGTHQTREEVKLVAWDYAKSQSGWHTFVPDPELEPLANKRPRRKNGWWATPVSKLSGPMRDGPPRHGQYWINGYKMGEVYEDLNRSGWRWKSYCFPGGQGVEESKELAKLHVEGHANLKQMTSLCGIDHYEAEKMRWRYLKRQEEEALGLAKASVDPSSVDK